MKISHKTNFLFSMLIRSIYLSFVIILASYAGVVNRIWFTVLAFAMLVATLTLYVFNTFHDAKETILRKEK
jgi:hypothetical protein